MIPISVRLGVSMSLCTYGVIQYPIESRDFIEKNYPRYFKISIETKTDCFDIVWQLDKANIMVICGNYLLSREFNNLELLLRCSICFSYACTH